MSEPPLEPERQGDVAIERFKNALTMIRYHNDKMIEAFSRSIKLTVVIAGASIGAYLKLEGIRDDVLILAPVIIMFVVGCSAAIIWSNCISRWRFRRIEADMLGKPDLQPQVPQAIKEQIIMARILAVLALLCISFLVAVRFEYWNNVCLLLTTGVILVGAGQFIEYLSRSRWQSRIKCRLNG